MQEQITKMLFVFIRSALTGQELNAEEKALYKAEILSPLFSLAKQHDIAHLVAVGLEKNDLLDKNNPLSQKFLQEEIKAVYRYEQLNYELERVCAALEKAEIPFLPLKGAVLRAYYPEPWLRTSCDIDILVCREDLERAISYLTEELRYAETEHSPHDISLFSNGGIHVELHFDLLEEGRAGNAIRVLEHVWGNVLAKQGSAYWFEMRDELFYFYHIAHMAKHFEVGGCGIRPFIDLWLLNQQTENVEKRKALLEQGGLWTFAQVVQRLSKVWLGQSEHDELTLRMEVFIVRGGVYGSSENRVVLQQKKKGGKFKYVWSRLFLPYNVLKNQYPILNKHRWLTPFMQIPRWFRAVFQGRTKRVLKEFRSNKNISDKEAEQGREFLKNIGL